jgi:hypothetical protein
MLIGRRWAAVSRLLLLEHLNSRPEAHDKGCRAGQEVGTLLGASFRDVCNHQKQENSG